jgi:hypothetical protein
VLVVFAIGASYVITNADVRKTKTLWETAVRVSMVENGTERETTFIAYAKKRRHKSIGAEIGARK